MEQSSCLHNAGNIVLLFSITWPFLYGKEVKKNPSQNDSLFDSCSFIPFTFNFSKYLSYVIESKRISGTKLLHELNSVETETVL